MNWFLFAGALAYLAVGAVASGVTDAYVGGRRGGIAGLAVGALFWPLIFCVAVGAFVAVGLYRLNRVAYDETMRIRTSRPFLYADEPPTPRDRERYGDMIER